MHTRTGPTGSNAINYYASAACVTALPLLGVELDNDPIREGIVVICSVIGSRRAVG